MTVERAVGLLLLLVLAGWAWWGERGRSSAAEALAAEQLAYADTLLAEVDSLDGVVEQLQAAEEAARLAYEDSLLVWAPRVAAANERALEARQVAEVLVADLSASLDSAQLVLLEQIEVEHRIEVEAITERAVTAEARVSALEVRVSTLTAANGVLTEQRDLALLASDAERAAAEILQAELDRRDWVRWGERAIAAAGWICAATCR